MAASERGCCMPRCGKTRKYDSMVLHSFPNHEKEMERYLKWTQAVGISVSSLDAQYVCKNRRLCHRHFETKFLTCSRRLSPNAVPTLFLAGSPTSEDVATSPNYIVSETSFDVTPVHETGTDIAKQTYIPLNNPRIITEDLNQPSEPEKLIKEHNYFKFPKTSEHRCIGDAVTVTYEYRRKKRFPNNIDTSNHSQSNNSDPNQPLEKALTINSVIQDLRRELANGLTDMRRQMGELRTTMEELTQRIGGFESRLEVVEQKQSEQYSCNRLESTSVQHMGMIVKTETTKTEII